MGTEGRSVTNGLKNHVQMVLTQLGEDDSVLVDTLLQCNDGSVPVPKIVLALLCPEFAKICKDDINIDKPKGPDGQDPILVVPDLSCHEIKIFLKYLFAVDIRLVYNGKEVPILQKVSQYFEINQDFSEYSDFYSEESEDGDEQFRFKTTSVTHQNSKPSNTLQKDFSKAALADTRKKEFGKLFKTVTCRHCGEHINMSLIMKHVKETHPEHQFRCLECREDFSSRRLLEVHVMKHTSSDCYLKCDICDIAFLTVSKLSLHLRAHKNARQNEDLHSCRFCPERFQWKIELNGHEAVCHPDELARHIQSSLKCTMCPRVFAKIFDLKRHIASHKGLKPFKCDKCDAHFVDSTRLKVHQNIHQRDTRFKCSMCEKSYSQKSKLIAHRRTHVNNSGEIVCNQCNRVFFSRFKLRNHMKWHLLEDNAQKVRKEAESMQKKTRMEAIRSIPIVKTKSNTTTRAHSSPEVVEIVDIDVPTSSQDQGSANPVSESYSRTQLRTLNPREDDPTLRDQTVASEYLEDTESADITATQQLQKVIDSLLSSEDAPYVRVSEGSSQSQPPVSMGHEVTATFENSVQIDNAIYINQNEAGGNIPGHISMSYGKQIPGYPLPNQSSADAISEMAAIKDASAVLDINVDTVTANANTLVDDGLVFPVQSTGVGESIGSTSINQSGGPLATNKDVSSILNFSQEPMFIIEGDHSSTNCSVSSNEMAPSSLTNQNVALPPAANHMMFTEYQADCQSGLIYSGTVDSTNGMSGYELSNGGTPMSHMLTDVVAASANVATVVQVPSTIIPTSVHVDSAINTSSGLTVPSVDMAEDLPGVSVGERPKRKRKSTMLSGIEGLDAETRKHLQILHNIELSDDQDSDKADSLFYEQFLRGNDANLDAGPANEVEPGTSNRGTNEVEAEGLNTPSRTFDRGGQIIELDTDLIYREFNV